jgi:hypothetical protein
MILYHASRVKVEKPDVKHSRESLDFGQGFYLTRIKEQALKYAERFIKLGEAAVLNVYDLDEDLTGIQRKIFEKYDGEWLDYIVSCRKLKEHECYDIIEGGIANDKVYTTVDLYMTGIYTKEQALQQLIFQKPNNQICIANQDVLDRYLHFVESIVL